jgi:hypothetical protein
MIEAKVRPIQGFQPGTDRPGRNPDAQIRKGEPQKMNCRVASGWRKPAGFPYARTFAQAGNPMTVGEIS